MFWTKGAARLVYATPGDKVEVSVNPEGKIVNEEKKGEKKDK